MAAEEGEGHSWGGLESRWLLRFRREGLGVARGRWVLGVVLGGWLGIEMGVGVCLSWEEMWGCGGFGCLVVCLFVCRWPIMAGLDGMDGMGWDAAGEVGMRLVPSVNSLSLSNWSRAGSGDCLCGESKKRKVISRLYSAKLVGRCSRSVQIHFQFHLTYLPT